MARIKCSVCGLYRGATPHSGALHKKIMANRDRFKARLGRAGGSSSGLSKRIGAAAARKRRAG